MSSSTFFLSILLAHAREKEQYPPLRTIIFSILSRLNFFVEESEEVSHESASTTVVRLFRLAPDFEVDGSAATICTYRYTVRVSVLSKCQ